MLEVLACADSAEAVIAAVQSGADSIYIRLGGRGARGFTEDALRKSVRYCRVRGCRVYAELDTLVSDAEAEAAASLARSASDMGADALIAQDLGFIAVALRGAGRAVLALRAHGRRQRQPRRLLARLPEAVQPGRAHGRLSPRDEARAASGPTRRA